MVVDLPESSSTGPKEEPPQAPNVAATQQTLAELTATLSNEGNQAVLEKVPPAQHGLTFSDKNTTTSSPTNTLSTTLQQLNECNEQSPTATATQEGDVDPEIQVQWAVVQVLQEITQKLLSAHIPSITVSKKTILSIKKLAKRYNQMSWKTWIISWLLLGTIWSLSCVYLASEFQIVVNGTIATLPNLMQTDYKKIIRLYHQNLQVEFNAKLFGIIFGRVVFDFLVFLLSGQIVYLRLDFNENYIRPLWQEGERRRQDAEACKELIPMIEQAVEAYRQGNVQEFINILFTQSANHPLLPLREVLSTTLERYGLGPDVIALVLMGLGEAARRGLSIPVYSPNLSQVKCQKILQYEYNALRQRKLAQEDLDNSVIESPKTWERVCELVKEEWQDLRKLRYTYKPWDKLLQSTIKTMESKHLQDDAPKMSSETLETMLQTIRMNLTTAQLKEKFSRRNTQCYGTLSRTTPYLTRPESQHPMSRLRLAAIKDLGLCKKS